jgi:8-oxo-dGTP pyrophosphatase MutT (NUDIX family)
LPAEFWKLLHTSVSSDQGMFVVRHDRYRLEPEGTERDFIVLDWHDWINVIALTPDQQVVLIRQFRHGVREVTLEVPGGLMEPDESPELAALRELREESGFAGQSAKLLGTIWPNPALQNNRLFTYLVEDVEPAGALELDPFERIEVDLRRLADIPQLIAGGEIRHALVLASFALLHTARSMTR